MFWVLNKEFQKDFPRIDENNVAGMLAANFVALAIREFTVPVSYSKNKPNEEIDFIAKKGTELIAIEVKFNDGETKSSTAALNRGDINHIVKVQRKVEASKEDMTIFPLSGVHELGVWLGHRPDKNKYTLKTINRSTT
jgi:predicted AAA+ superfamily ATPase